MKNEKLQKFKEIMRQGMIMNFEENGNLAPVMFFYKADEPAISLIPPEFLSTSEGKQMLSSLLKSICREPDVIAAGIIIEAYGAKMHQDSELAKLVESGAMKISELKEKQDIIVMIFSTPEGEECIAYEVEPKTKTVGRMFTDSEATNYGGTFSNFFGWNRN